jgi:chorismate-pyruvate lyase
MFRPSGCRIGTLIKMNCVELLLCVGCGGSINTLFNMHSGRVRISLWDKCIVKKNRRNSRKLVQRRKESG